ncbi:MAG: hypothetical protein HYR62_01895 [Actinobacteria bacterium]|nr:hypothetical protein [Actinomycetota bacterium]MBI3687235.1 hypothetical protein [Actinomycetota bacterium]
MAYGSGLAAQLGVKAETVVGTEVVVDTFYEFTSASPTFKPTWITGQGLRAGQAYERAARVSQGVLTVDGEISLEYTDRGHMGLLWRHALGSAITVPTQIAASTAYKQVHTPGPKAGLGLTVQLGRPQTDGTVRPFTYRGVKVPEWEFTVSAGSERGAELTLNIDAWQENTATALAVASYAPAAQLFTFVDAATFKLGGTATTTAGETTISGGLALGTVFSELTIKGETGMKVDRYGLGGGGVKKEQLENAVPTITGQLKGEFTNRVEIYDVFRAGTPMPLQLDFSHGDAGGGNPYLLSFILPAVKITETTIDVDGGDLLGQEVAFKAFDDGTNPVLQVKLVSTDTTL